MMEPRKKEGSACPLSFLHPKIRLRSLPCPR